MVRFPQRVRGTRAHPRSPTRRPSCRRLARYIRPTSTGRCCCMTPPALPSRPSGSRSTFRSGSLRPRRTPSRSASGTCPRHRIGRSRRMLCLVPERLGPCSSGPARTLRCWCRSPPCLQDRSSCTQRCRPPRSRSRRCRNRSCTWQRPRTTHQGSACIRLCCRTSRSCKRSQAASASRPCHPICTRRSSIPGPQVCRRRPPRLRTFHPGHRCAFGSRRSSVRPRERRSGPGPSRTAHLRTTRHGTRPSRTRRPACMFHHIGGRIDDVLVRRTLSCRGRHGPSNVARAERDDGMPRAASRAVAYE